MIRSYFSQLPMQPEALIILVLFSTFFAAMSFIVFRKGAKARYEHTSHLPLED